VFFPQERVGLNGRVFEVLKFRSMVAGAEALSGPVQAEEHDPRVTRVGRMLRATALDELPQLWNILIGDMSFVGPRPLRPGEIDRAGEGRPVALADIPGYVRRHSVRPGLTGLAQVYAPRDVPRAEKFRLDLQYLDEAGLWLDLKLLILSLWITARGEWENRDRPEFANGSAPPTLSTLHQRTAGLHADVRLADRATTSGGGETE
jgi:lipopolysaccharide/colanic/teichoic acid biosynthesis glycosyltransferase